MNCYNCKKQICAGNKAVVDGKKVVLCHTCNKVHEKNEAKEIKVLKQELINLDELIKAGEEFEAQGHECGGMNCINISIRNKVAKKISELESVLK